MTSVAFQPGALDVLLPVCCVPMPSFGVLATLIGCVVCTVHNCLDLCIGCMRVFLGVVCRVVHVVVLHSA